jgi:hypothetical protein
MNEIYVCGKQGSCKFFEPQGGFSKDMNTDSGLQWAREILPCVHIGIGGNGRPSCVYPEAIDAELNHPFIVLEKAQRSRFINAGIQQEAVEAILATAPLTLRPDEQEVLKVECYDYRIWREKKPGGGLIYYIRNTISVQASFRGTSCLEAARYLMVALSKFACH